MALAHVSDVVAALDGLGVPSAQLAWPDQNAVPPPPYAILAPHETRSLYADGVNRAVARRYDIELYAKERDLPLERRLADALTQAGIAYASDVAMDEKGQVAITYFSVTLKE